MKSRTFVAASLLLCWVNFAAASDFKIGSLEIDHVWSPATPKGAAVAAGYLTVRNKGTTPDRLIGGSVVVAGRLSIHEMSTTDGVSRMRPVADGVEIKPGEIIELKPGSFHLMFMDLKQPLTPGQHIKGTLVFAKAGTVEVEFDVQPIGGTSMSPESMPGMHDHMH